MISLGEDVAVTYPILLEANSISILNYTGYMCIKKYEFYDTYI